MIRTVYSNGRLKHTAQHQAEVIQSNRVSNGKPGWSKAVRRWARREALIHEGDVIKLVDWEKYRRLLNSLPFIPIPVPTKDDEYRQR